ncbi:FtsQ-type POTRA domain-containing protein [Pelagibius sp. 7325]|uniref:cell division protein FtsQ/DivIB n=1 Tax=Pelagibius sp. 7325 TaxID=3131994 RepID=UPI0030EE467A
MRFLNPFSRSTNKRAARGGSKRKVKKSTRRRSRSVIDWRLVRRIVPVGGAVLLVGSLYWLYQDGWFGRQAEALQQAALDGTASLGLRIEEVLVEGRARTDGAEILTRLGLVVGRPILAVDPDVARAELEALPWVQTASVERQLPGTIYIRLTEREPLALWQENGVIRVIDRDGGIIPGVEPRRFAHLPLVVGPDAPAHAAKLIAVMNSEPDLRQRVTAAVRVGGRRWNVQIEGRIDVRLPEADTAAAWSQLARIERQQGLLSRDVIIIDLRLPDRLVVRTDPDKGPLGHEEVKGEST